MMAAHGNGFLYAVYGNVLVKLDPATGRRAARRELPEDPALTGAAYNGLIVLPDGNIVAKKIERGPCATPGALPGLHLLGDERPAVADRGRRAAPAADPLERRATRAGHRAHHLRRRPPVRRRTRLAVPVTATGTAS